MIERGGPKLIDLALQGGGSHGAFTWGVLDRLLQTESLEIGGISGTSAGAMNAVVLASGYAEGGRTGARDRLHAFWSDIGESGNAASLSPFAALFDPWQGTRSPWLTFYDLLSRFLSPYQLNPFNYNPLRDVVERHVNIAAVRELESLRLFVSATNVHTGQHRVFRNAELDVDAVMASACLPVLFHAVVIDGEHYWDGGYTSNPALLPLIAESRPRDLILVQINPVERRQVPQHAHEIIDRINEISFNASLNQELRTLGLLKDLLRQESTSGNAYRGDLFQRIDAVYLHRIEAHKQTRELGASSRLNARWAFLQQLHDMGHAAADRWLAEHADDIGKRSTLDLGTNTYGDPCLG